MKRPAGSAPTQGAKPRPSFPASLGSVAPAAVPARPAVTGRARLDKPASVAAVGAVPTGVGLDSQAVRHAMVRKLAAQGLQDPRVQQAFATVERHCFVDSALVTQAYEDTSLPIG